MSIKYSRFFFHIRHMLIEKNNKAKISVKHIILFVKDDEIE